MRSTETKGRPPVTEKVPTQVSRLGPFYVNEGSKLYGSDWTGQVSVGRGHRGFPAVVDSKTEQGGAKC